MKTCQKLDKNQLAIPHVRESLRAVPFYLGNNYRRRIRPTALEYFDIRNISQKICRDFAPDKTMFFAIGRSPTPIAAYMAQMPAVHIRNVPGSRGLRGKQMDPKENPDFFAALSTVSWLRRQLVLIDYCLSGTTLAFFVRLATEWAHTNKIPIEVRGAALVHEPMQASELMQADLANSIRVYPLAEFPTLRDCLFREDYDRLAPYSAPPRQSTDSNRQIYQAYCRNIRECMLYDAASQSLSFSSETSTRALC